MAGKNQPKVNIQDLLYAPKKMFHRHHIQRHINQKSSRLEGETLFDNFSPRMHATRHRGTVETQLVSGVRDKKQDCSSVDAYDLVENQPAT